MRVSDPDEPDSHGERIRRAFTDQAAAFEDRRFNRVFTTDSAWLFERVAREPSDLVLDVAAGTGHAARQLAADVGVVVAVDATEAMLRQGRDAARAEGRRNIVFVVGQAGALPFLDGGFDIVVCRFAVHHFEEAGRALGEMRRCLAPGGRLAVADLVADPDPGVAEVQNELERWRDPSHTRMLPAAELRAWFDELDLIEVDVECRSVARPIIPWLEQARTPRGVADRIVARLREELGGGAPTGLSPAVVDGEIWFAQTFASCVGVAAPASR